jgi:hypothetical protein
MKAYLGVEVEFHVDVNGKIIKLMLAKVNVRMRTDFIVLTTGYASGLLRPR